MKLLITNNERDRAGFDMAVWGPIIAAAEEVWIDDICIKTHQTERPDDTVGRLAGGMLPDPLANDDAARHAFDDRLMAERGREIFDGPIEGNPMRPPAVPAPGETANEYLLRAERERLLRAERERLAARASHEAATDIIEPEPILRGVEYEARRAWGTANIKSVNDIVVCGPLGRRHDFLTFWPAGARVRTGCFEGTLDEFRHKVVEDYGDQIGSLESSMAHIVPSMPMAAERYQSLRLTVLQLEAWRDQYLVTVDGWRQWAKNPRGQA